MIVYEQFNHNLPEVRLHMVAKKIIMTNKILYHQ